MKKLLAILLSVLMLCSVIPFAAVAVSAADEYYIELVADAEEVNAGDEVTVEVSLYGHESVGLIGLQLELLFNSDVFELVTYYDEDEEMWMPPIEVGPKFSASSNKYIMFSPIDEETGYMERCLVQFLRSTASATQAVKTNLFYTVTFKVKDDAPSGTYELIPDGYQGGNTVAYGNASLGDLFSVENLSITVNGSEPSCEHEYEYDCSKVCSLCGEETRPEAEHEYFTPCDQYCMICYELTNPDAAHNVIHVEALEPTCTELGNIEYWYCDACGAAWLDEDCTQNTNLMSVKLGASCKYGAEHVAAKDADCYEEGNYEYWYCANCDVYYADADCTVVTNRLNLIIPVSHNIVHVDALEPTCTELGNIEYWYCDICGQAWLDELCHLNTNLQSVKLAASCKYGAEHVAAKDANCYEPGNIEYWYCANCDVYYADADCTIITNAKNVIIPVSHNVIHVEAADPTCTENGNIEYWYCDICGQAWLDELCHLNTNLRAVVLPMADHVYDNAHDATCNVCGAVRDIVLSADEIILHNGKSVSELKSGLAFKFDVAVEGLAISEEYVADYTNAIVNINGEECKLITMGAIANNKGLSNQTLDNVDGDKVLNIVAEKAFEIDGTISYAVRIINIPEAHLDTAITVCSYYVYEDAAGVQHTVYGEDVVSSYNDVING